MNEVKRKEFLVKLQNLLEEYNATINFEASECSDWRGLSGVRMSIKMSNCEDTSFWYQEEISAYDLKCELQEND